MQCLFVVPNVCWSIPGNVCKLCQVVGILYFSQPSCSVTISHRQAWHRYIYLIPSCSVAHGVSDRTFHALLSCPTFNVVSHVKDVVSSIILLMLSMVQCFPCFPPVSNWGLLLQVISCLILMTSPSHFHLLLRMLFTDFCLGSWGCCWIFYLAKRFLWVCKGIWTIC